MSLVCPANHQWDAPAYAAADSRCPVCGAAALASAIETLPPSDGNGAAEPFTGPYLPGMDAPTAILSSPGMVSAPPPTAAYPQVPGYSIDGVLGRGGMGIVYRAQQTSLSRPVALKMMLAGADAGSEDLERFRAEAEAVARLSHPNIVQIHEVGDHQGAPFFSLEFVEGGGLDRRLKGVPQPPGAAGRLAETLARAMHVAHQRGIVHRDLKPANVLVAADGTPKITDFGLAKRLDADSSQTRSGTIMGTPSYMAPEQAEGRTLEVGAAADVYALGAILYELLTGRPPFRGSTPVETLLQVVHDEPVPPSRLQPTVPRDLETVCLKCLEKEPAKRYANAIELAEDLRRFQVGEPTLARPVGLAGRLHKWARRNPTVASLSALAIVLAIAGLSGVSWQLHETSEALEREKEARGDAQVKTIEAETAHENEKKKAEEYRQLLYDSQMDRAYQAWDQGRVGVTLRILDDLRPAPGQTDLRRAEWFCLWQLCHGERWVFRGHSRVVVATAFSPDGKWLATGSPDRSVRLCSIETGECRVLASWPVGRGVFALAFAPDGRTLAVGGGPGQDLSAGYVAILDVKTGAVRVEHRQPATVYGLAFQPSGERLASAGFDGIVRVYDVHKGTLERELKGHDSAVLCVAYSPDGALLASGGWDKTARLWNAKDGTPGPVMKTATSYVQAVTFSPDGSRLASGGNSRAAYLWDVASGRRVRDLSLGDWGEVKGLAYLPNGAVLATGLTDGHRGTIALLDPRSGGLVAVNRGHTDGVAALTISPDGRWLASGSEDRTARVWDVWKFWHETPEVTSIAYVPDGKTMALARGREVRLINAGSRAVTATFAHEQRVQAVATSPDGRWLAACEGEIPSDRSNPNPPPGIVVIRTLPDGRVHGVLRGYQGGVFALAFAPDSRHLASGGSDQQVRIWDVERCQEVKTLKGFSDPVRALAFTPDGKRLAAGGGQRWRTISSHVRIWNVDNGQIVASLAHHDPVYAIAFSGDGQTLATGGLEYDVSIWDVPGGRRRFVLEGHTSTVLGLAFSPDGSRLASSGDDNRLCLWNTATGQRAGRIPVGAHGVWGIAFAPDGRTVAVGGHTEGDVSGVTFWHTAPWPGDTAPAK
jgi:WD40 repeat protein